MQVYEGGRVESLLKPDGGIRPDGGFPARHVSMCLRRETIPMSLSRVGTLNTVDFLHPSPDPGSIRLPNAFAKIGLLCLKSYFHTLSRSTLQETFIFPG